MKITIYILTFFHFFNLFSQIKNDENIENLIAKYSVKPELECEILVSIDVEGMFIPDKKIMVGFKNGEKPKVEGKGLALLPKKGTINQFNQLLTAPLQAIFLSEINNNLSYKIVSLDQKSDWITADITFNKNTLQIHSSVINTRKHGTFYTNNIYIDSSKTYPLQSIIKFDIKKFKIPLKFIGREQQVSKSSHTENKNVQGIITLNYTYLD